MELLDTLKRSGIHDARVLAAITKVPRERFVPEELRPRAYENVALPIGEGQTISQPYIVAKMTQALALEPTHRVLEIGTGSGYQAAILAELAGEVFSIERLPAIAARARRTLDEAGYARVRVFTGDGTLGLPEHAPFDRILVTAGAPQVPEALRAQLVIGGILIVPVARGQDEVLASIRRVGEGAYTREDLDPVRFVPLIGEQGWANGRDARDPALI